MQVKDNAELVFEGSPETITIGKLEVQYGATLYGEGTVSIDCNSIILHPQSALNFSATGHPPGEGPGAGMGCR